MKVWRDHVVYKTISIKLHLTDFISTATTLSAAVVPPAQLRLPTEQPGICKLPRTEVVMFEY